MKANRLGLLGLAVVAGILAACEGDTVVQQPPQDTTPDISVTVLPNAATLTVGQTRQLTAVITGTTNQAANWETSAPAVATVSATGLVTAVSAGVAVVTAVSQADPTKRAAATITVEIAPAASIVITSITTGNTNTPVNTQNVFGQIDITAELNVPQGAAVQRVEFLVDNVVQPNCTQTFNSAGATDDPDAAQVPILCSINTAAFNATTGVPTFLNGPHRVSAQVVAPNGTVTASSGQDLVFNNPSFLIATPAFLQPGTTTAKACVNSGTNARSQGGAGTLWCGGDLAVTVLGVNYGGASNAIASATVVVSTSGVGVSGATGCRTTSNLATDPTIATVDGGAGPTPGNFPGCPAATPTKQDNNAADGLSVNFSSTANPDATTPGVQNIEDVITISVNTVTTGGQAGPTCVNPTPGPNPINTCGIVGGTSAPNVAFFANPMRLDNLAPRITLFSLFPPTCDQPSCWVNGSFAFTAGRAGFYTSVDYGVDHQNASTSFQAGASTSSLVNVTTAATLDNTSDNTDLFLRASARDSLGNQRQVFPTPTPTIVQTSSTTPTPQKFGVDKVSPFILAGITTPPDMGANDGFSYIISAADTATPPAGPSGINTGPSGPNAPIIVRAERLTPTATACLDPDAGAETTFSCSTGGNQGNGTEAVANGLNFMLGNPTTNAYYRVTYKARDRATNETTTSTVITLLDNVAPGVGAVLPGQGAITGNALASWSLAVTDNVDLGDVASYVEYPGVGIATFVQDVAAPTSIGSYGPDSFTTSSNATSMIPNFIRSIQVFGNAAINRASSITFNVRDVAGVVDADVCPATGVPVTDVPTSTANCTALRTSITNAVNAGIGASNPETSFGAIAGFNTWNTLTPNPVGPICNGTTQAAPPGQPCPTNPATSTVLSARASGASATFQNSPFVRVNFYYFNAALTGGRSILIGSGTQTATTDDGVTRSFNWQITWTPAGLAAGTYTVFALGVDSKGQGLVFDTQNVTVTID